MGYLTGHTPPTAPTPAPIPVREPVDINAALAAARAGTSDTEVVTLHLALDQVRGGRPNSGPARQRLVAGNIYAALVVAETAPPRDLGRFRVALTTTGWDPNRLICWALLLRAAAGVGHTHATEDAIGALARALALHDHRPVLDAATIDRIEHFLGAEPGNITILPETRRRSHVIIISALRTLTYDEQLWCAQQGFTPDELPADTVNVAAFVDAATGYTAAGSSRTLRWLTAYGHTEAARTLVTALAAGDCQWWNGADDGLDTIATTYRLAPDIADALLARYADSLAYGANPSMAVLHRRKNTTRNVWDTPALLADTTADPNVGLLIASRLWNLTDTGPSDTVAADLAARCDNPDVLWAAASWTHPDGPSTGLLATVEQYAADGRLPDTCRNLPDAVLHWLATTVLGPHTTTWVRNHRLRPTIVDLLARGGEPADAATLEQLFGPPHRPTVDALTVSDTLLILDGNHADPDALVAYCAPEVVAFVDTYANQPHVCPEQLAEAVKNYLPDQAATQRLIDAARTPTLSAPATLAAAGHR